MTREIKFRDFNPETKEMKYYPLERYYDNDCNVYGNIMQYTGLKDKNNKEIYEGDVVMIDHWKSSDLFDYSKPFSVEYYEGEINFKQGIYNNMKGSLQGKLITEIIGNIYETPNLIKELK